MRLVWVSDWSGKPASTGYSRVSANVLKYLHEKGHEVIEVGVGYQGHGFDCPWPTYSPTAHGGRLEGQDLAARVAKQSGADAMVLLMDPPDTAWALTYMDKKGQPLPEDIVEALDKRDFALCMYSPIDGSCADGRLPTSWGEIFGGSRSFDAFASPSKFGQRLLSEVCGRKAAWLPHGVDENIFRPMGTQQESRERLGLPRDNLTLVYVAVNKRRKMVPAFFETAAKLIDRVPSLTDGTHPFFKGVTILFHGDDREDNFDLDGLERTYGLERPNVSSYHTQYFTESGLALLYSAADIFVGLSGGEGFMIPAIEAQACRVPALVTDYSAMQDVVPDAEQGWSKVPPKALMPQPFNLIRWTWPDTDSAAERIEAYAADRGLRMRLRKAAFEYSRKFLWSRVLPWIEQWLLEAIEANKDKQGVLVEAVS